MITKTNRPIVTRGHLNLRYLHLEDEKAVCGQINQITLTFIELYSESTFSQTEDLKNKVDFVRPFSEHTVRGLIIESPYRHLVS